MKDISLHLMDIVQNSITAGATLIGITLVVDETENRLTLSIEDNGKGMDEAMVQRVTSPFTTTRTTRKVGLGIPLFVEGAERTGGTFSIKSRVGEGTVITASYVLDHIDRPPLGDMAGTVFMLVYTNEALDFFYTVRCGARTFTMDTREVREVLEGLPLTTPEVASWLKEQIAAGEQEICGGVLE